MSSALLPVDELHLVGLYDLLVCPRREHAQETGQVIEPDLGDPVVGRRREPVRRLRAHAELDLGREERPLRVETGSV
jgi:hypothetical protein